MASVTAAATEACVLDPQRDRLVIVASSLGTVFEWYDFFVYGTLAALLGRLFFPSENPTAALLLSLATFGAGFGVRPVGALLFGVLGDRVGRKYTFLITITLMGIATAAVGLLPTYAHAGLWAPVLLVSLRLLQGLALGGEYGGAAIYVAEHAPPGKRGFFTSFIQMSVVGGFLLSLCVVLLTTAAVGQEAFEAWGWRIPFLASLLLLGVSLYIRLKLRESPVFAAMKAAGTTAKAPLREAFALPGNARTMLVAMIGVAAGLTVIWYTAQFQTLYFLQRTALIDDATAALMVGGAMVAIAPLFVVFGWLSDKVGRKPVMLGGYGCSLLLLFPAFHLLAGAANPMLAAATARAPVTIAGPGCQFNPFAGRQATPCGEALQFLAGRGIGHSGAIGRGETLTVRVGDTVLTGFDKPGYEAALTAAGYPSKPYTGPRNTIQIMLAIALLGVLSASTYGPVAAIMVELFPARIRYTSMSLPYHIGTGYFGGFLPLIALYVVAKTGNPFGGLWYTWGVVAAAFVVTLLWLPETRDRDIRV